MKLDNQTAVITGGASGLGGACARFLESAGAKVSIWDKFIDSNQNSNTAINIACDVRLEEDVKRALDITIENFGVPRICINCAGIAPAKRLLSKKGVMPLMDFKNVIEVNLVGTFNVMRVLADAMAKLPLDIDSGARGVIINTASVAAFEGQIGQIAYSASKGGVVAMTLPAARELADHGIRVNTIAPGLMATPMLLNMPQEIQDNLIKTLTFPKRLGNPEEFARLAMHLIENELINGEVIRLDGALRMQAR